MSLFHYMLGLLFGSALAVGQILFKVAANQVGPTGEKLPMLRLLFTWPMMSAVALYAFTVILYVYLLQEVPLSRAYMFSFIGSALVPVLAIIIFNEPISARYVIGVVLVLAGVVLTTTGQQL